MEAPEVGVCVEAAEREVLRGDEGMDSGYQFWSVSERAKGGGIRCFVSRQRRLWVVKLKCALAIHYRCINFAGLGVGSDFGRVIFKRTALAGPKSKRLAERSRR